jgi:hypothetical protein
MDRYERIFKEDEEESKFDKRVTDILKVLRDSNYGNEDSRKQMLDHLTSLHNSKDPRARKSFKLIGDLFTDIGDMLIQMAKEEKE